MEVIGLIPAAGRATRISPLPCSKEVYPVEPPRAEMGGGPKVVSQFLLEKMSLAGASKAYFVLRPGKWDIPGYFGDGSRFNMRFAYLPLDESPGVPFTLDHAYPFVRHGRVAFGFPDILLNPPDAFVKMLDQQRRSSADVTLGVCRATAGLQNDLVDFDERGVVREMTLKPHDDPFRYSWALALWTPVFTEFLHGYADQNRASAHAFEISAGHVIQAAVHAGLKIEAIVLSEETYLDIGTPAGLAEALRRGLQHVL